MHIIYICNFSYIEYRTVYYIYTVLYYRDEEKKILLPPFAIALDTHIIYRMMRYDAQNHAYTIQSPKATCGWMDGWVQHVQQRRLRRHPAADILYNFRLPNNSSAASSTMLLTLASIAYLLLYTSSFYISI